MELWTVDTWQVRQGVEDEFLALLSQHSVGGDRVFRDLNQPRTYWAPRRWDSKSQLEDWHSDFSNVVAGLLETASTHVMTAVEE